MNESIIYDIARDIREAYTGSSISAPSKQLDSPDIKTAYLIQARNTDFWIQEGRRVVGRKIGLTSLAVQKQLGVDQPDYGTLFADMCYGDGEVISLGNMHHPRAEVEVALVLDKNIESTQPTIADVLAATAYALPAIEVADSRVKDWKITIFDTIADNASAGLFILGGTPQKLHKLDLRRCGMMMTRDGEPVSTGAGAACMGHPLNAAVWLAGKMAELGQPLQAGDIVMTGALGPMVDIKAGDSLFAEISGLGSVGARFVE
ncbi:MAG: fumarylacetoacetate hydrolase family protein [Bacteroidia bacterium]